MAEDNDHSLLSLTDDIILNALESYLLENTPDDSYRQVLDDYLVRVHRLLGVAGLSQPSKS